MNSYFDTKKVLIIILGLAVLAFGFWVYFQNTKVYEFAGNVDKIENGEVFINGHFLKNGKPIPGQENDIITLQIKTDNNTKITRLALNIPTGVGSFDTKDLKQEESVVSLEIIAKDFLQPHLIGVESLLRKGFLEKDFTAKSLYFRVPIFSN